MTLILAMLLGGSVGWTFMALIEKRLAEQEMKDNLEKLNELRELEQDTDALISSSDIDELLKDYTKRD